MLSMCERWGRGLGGAQSLSDLRDTMAHCKSGKWLGDSVSEEVQVLFGGGLLHLTDQEAERRWLQGSQLLAQHLLSEEEAQALVPSYMAARMRMQHTEEYLEEAVEGQLLFLHQNGWFLRTLAVLMRHDGAATADAFQPDNPGVLATILRGVLGEPRTLPDSDGQGPSTGTPDEPARPGLTAFDGPPAALGAAGEGAPCAWKAGLLHRILSEVLSLHPIEGSAGCSGENEYVHPCLGRADLQDNFTMKDAWSRQPICYDTEALTAVLAMRMTPARSGERAGASSSEAQALREAAAACVDARVLSPFDGYNTLQRLQVRERVKRSVKTW